MNPQQVPGLVPSGGEYGDWEQAALSMNPQQVPGLVPSGGEYGDWEQTALSMKQVIYRNSVYVYIPPE